MAGSVRPYFYIASEVKLQQNFLEYTNKLSHRGLAWQTLFKAVNERIFT